MLTNQKSHRLSNKSMNNALNAMNTKIIKAIAAAALLISLIAMQTLSQPAWAEGDVTAGRAIGQTCAGCHGASGMRNAYPGYRVPKLGGQHQDYIAASLRAYRSGERNHPTMRAHANAMSDEDINNIAAYIASLKD